MQTKRIPTEKERRAEELRDCLKLIPSHFPIDMDDLNEIFNDEN